MDKKQVCVNKCIPFIEMVVVFQVKPAGGYLAVCIRSV